MAARCGGEARQRWHSSALGLRVAAASSGGAKTIELEKEKKTREGITYIGEDYIRKGGVLEGVGLGGGEGFK